MGQVKAQKAAREAAIANGVEYMSEDEEDEEDVPTITMQMLILALGDATRSVTQAEYQKYLDMKELFESQSGSVGQSVVNPVQNVSAPVQGNGANQALNLDDDDEEDELDDIYA